MAATLVSMMLERAAELGSAPLFTFLTDGERREETLSYAAVDRRARAIGAHLAAAGLAGERVVLLYPPGMEYITAFLGCLYAGAVAVPAYPPNPARLQRTLPRLRALVQSAKAEAFLTTAALREMSQSLAELAPELAMKRWFASDTIADGEADTWKEPRLDADAIAFLQYTSGSTGAPKGVVLTHGNLMHNEKMISSAFAHDRDLVGVGWLPLYHDMGLIGNVLGTVYAGGKCVLLSPLQFLAAPFRWLDAISRHRGTTSGGPNFAYEMCVQKITAEERATLDLRSWKVAFNGAEPIRAQTLQRFRDTFGPCGFEWRSFLPCYGLAEASLIVSGKLSPEGPTIAKLDVTKLEIGNRAVKSDAPDAREVVGCGPIVPEMTVRIVEPSTGQPLDDGDIGEVWVTGKSVAKGYFGDEEATAKTFHASLPDAPGVTFLRTGDLGFFGENGELFIAGRIKDLLIIRGRNYYPHDLEEAAEGAHAALRKGCGVAVSYGEGDDVKVALLFEYDAKKVPEGEGAVDAAARAIREAVGDEHELRVDTVVLLKPNEIPKTSSGKVMRAAAARAWRENKLSVLHTSTEGAVGKTSTNDAPAQQASANPTEREIVGFILDWFANPRIGLGEIDKSLDALGLDSVGAVRLAQSLSRWLGRKVPPTIFWDYPTISSLAKHLASSGGPS